MIRFDAWVELLDVKVLNEEDTKIINHACNSVLSYSGKKWTKKDQDSIFDVPVRSYFGAELCDLVGLYILDRLQKTYMSN